MLAAPAARAEETPARHEFTETIDFYTYYNAFFTDQDSGSYATTSTPD
jgi:hypothetical protein